MMKLVATIAAALLFQCSVHAWTTLSSDSRPKERTWRMILDSSEVRHTDDFPSASGDYMNEMRNLPHLTMIRRDNAVPVWQGGDYMNEMRVKPEATRIRQSNAVAPYTSSERMRMWGRSNTSTKLRATGRDRSDQEQHVPNPNQVVSNPVTSSRNAQDLDLVMDEKKDAVTKFLFRPTHHLPDFQPDIEELEAVASYQDHAPADENVKTLLYEAINYLPDAAIHRDGAIPVARGGDYMNEMRVKPEATRIRQSNAVTPYTSSERMRMWGRPSLRATGKDSSDHEQRVSNPNQVISNPVTSSRNSQDLDLVLDEKKDAVTKFLFRPTHHLPDFQPDVEELEAVASYQDHAPADENVKTLLYDAMNHLPGTVASRTTDVKTVLSELDKNLVDFQPPEVKEKEKVANDIVTSTGQTLPFDDRVHIDFDDMAPGPDYLQ